MKRTAKIALFIGILLIGLAGVAIYWTFYRPLPDYNITLELSQLNAPVEVKWDNYGVPHIYADNKHDLYMAVGYVHAQDRLWQMTVSQMAAQGRFAEFLGEDLVPIDKLQRTIGFWRIARQMEDQLPDSTRRILQAYAQGVNQYVEQHKKGLPIQFSLAGMNPISWTPTHSLALARLMAWELNIAWKAELTYNALFDKLSPAQFGEIFPNPKISANLPEPVTADSGLSTVINPLLQQYHKYQQLLNVEGTHTGSNAWAANGEITGTGKPLLAGDPHLALSIPGKWYEVHLHLNGRNLSGATLPGAPSVVLGQNNALAWSFTNMMLDDTDFFEEQLHPQDSSRYLLDSLAGDAIYEQFTIQREVIKVKDGDDRTFTRKLTKHGPVISNIYPEQDLTAGKTISMQWTGQQPGSEFQALQAMGWATTIKEFENGVQQFKTPAQNIIYADTAGNISLFTAGRVPIRAGNPIVLRPGWRPQMDWQGFVEYQDLPSLTNPDKGWVANANNPVVEDFPYYLSVYWQPDSRYQRIRQFLNNNDDLTIAAFQVMQNDSYSSYASTLTDIVLPVLKNDADTSFTTATDYLENWDFHYGKSETAASIMEVFLLRLTENTLSDELGPALYEHFIFYSATPERVILDFLQNDSRFFDNINTETVENRENIIQQSMQQALSILRDRLGDEPAEWRWDNLHQITLRPAFFGQAAQDSSASQTLQLIVQNVLSKGPFPVAGNKTTINNGEYRWFNPFNMIVGPSIRRIVDLSDTRQSLSIIPGGQSGNPLSKYYNDQTQNWLNGQYKFLIHDSTQFENYGTTRLIPEK